ncbi:MAG: hypothetical protein WBP47_22720, partial [Candidatus Promineifilaceae bacterium]
MRKSVLYILGLLIVLALALSACGGASTTSESAAEPTAVAPAEESSAAEPTTAVPAATEKQVLNVWSFTNEIMTMAIAFEGMHPDVDVVYTMIPMTAGEYQTKLKA